MKFLTYLDLTGNEIRNVVAQNLPSAPSSPVQGQFYYDTGLKEFGYYNGTSWVYTASGSVQSVTAGNTTITIGGTASQPTVAVAKTLDHTYITDFDTQVRTSRLDQMATPAANVAWGGFKITGLANGTAATDAAAFGQIPTSLPPSGAAGGDLTGTYPNPTLQSTSNVQAIVAAASSQKQACRVVATTNINTATGGLVAVDGVTVAAGDRVLLTAQSTATQNGIWIAASGAWSRAADMAAGSSQYGVVVEVFAGSAYAGTTWQETNTVAAAVGTTALVFTQAAPYGGTGITTVGNTLSVTYGTAAGTAAQGNDSRIVNSLQTTTSFSGDITGTYATTTLNATTNVNSIIRANRLDQFAAPTAAVSFGNQKITNLANGTASTDAATFGQIPTTLPPSGAAGGDLSGTYPNPTLSATTNVNNIIRANRLDQFAAPTAAVSFGGQQITNLADPTSAQQAATKNYVDTVAQGLSVHTSVVAASTTPLSPGNTYSGGVLTASANGALTIDGVAVTAGQRVLVAGEATAANNGIYTVTNAGGASANYVLTRATDMNTGTQVPGAFVFVESGTANANSGFVVSSGVGPYTIGTTAITWTQFSGAGEITAGTGLTKTGNTLALSTPVSLANGGTGATTAAGVRTNIGATTKFSATIGDGTSTSFAVVHNFGTRDVQVQVYDNATFETIYTQNVRTDANTVTVSFATAPASGAYRVVVIG